MNTRTASPSPAVLLAALLAGFSTSATAAADAQASAAIAAAIASTERPETDRSQDGPRKGFNTRCVRGSRAM